MQAQLLSKVEAGVSVSPQFPDISGDEAGECSQLCGKQPLVRTRDWTVVDGTPLPLGATWIEDAQAWNFALYSKDAEERYAAALRGSGPGQSRFHVPLRLPP